MKQIIVKQSDMIAVREGKKTQTLRYWAKCNIQVGDTVNLSNYRIKMPVKITAIYNKLLWELTPEEIIFNGYASLTDLSKRIFEHYPNCNGKMTVIKFLPI